VLEAARVSKLHLDDPDVAGADDAGVPLRFGLIGLRGHGGEGVIAPAEPLT
jgi:hypothetical protein